MKIKNSVGKEYLFYTVIFFMLMTALYAYSIFEVGTDMPKFTSAEF